MHFKVAERHDMKIEEEQKIIKSIICYDIIY